MNTVFAWFWWQFLHMHPMRLSEENFKFTHLLAIFRFFLRTPFWIRLIYFCALLDLHDLTRDFNFYVILCCKGLNWRFRSVSYCVISVTLVLLSRCQILKIDILRSVKNSHKKMIYKGVPCPFSLQQIRNGSKYYCWKSMRQDPFIQWV
jgi:hypothetical protein